MKWRSYAWKLKDHAVGNRFKQISIDAHDCREKDF